MLSLLTWLSTSAWAVFDTPQYTVSSNGDTNGSDVDCPFNWCAYYNALDHANCIAEYEMVSAEIDGWFQYCDGYSFVEAQCTLDQDGCLVQWNSSICGIFCYSMWKTYGPFELPLNWPGKEYVIVLWS